MISSNCKEKAHVLKFTSLSCTSDTTEALH
jgi:hypothetical protein